MNNTRKYILLFILSVVFLIVVYTFAFLLPLNEEIMKIKREYNILLTEVLSCNNDYNDELLVQDNYMAKLNTEIDNIIDSLPDSLLSHEILDLLSGIKELPIQRNSLIFLSESGNEQYRVIPVRLSFKTHINGLKQFFEYLDNIEETISVNGFQFSLDKAQGSSDKKNRNAIFSDNVDSSNNMGYNLNVVLTVNFYLKPYATETCENRDTDSGINEHEIAGK